MSEFTLKLPDLKKIAAYTAPFTLPLAIVTLAKFVYAFAGVTVTEEGAAFIATAGLFVGVALGSPIAMGAAFDKLN